MTTNPPTRVCHITESMGGGVVTFLDSISRRQAECGVAVSVWFTRRPDTPSADVLAARFHPRVSLREIEPKRGAFGVLRGLAAALRSVSPSDFDAVHLHSSYAGAIGRAVIHRRSDVSYSPHGFGFLREDKKASVRSIIRIVEMVLARRGRIIVTSRSEFGIAAQDLRAPRVEYLQSGVPRASISKPEALGACEDPDASQDKRPTVIMTGRMVFQKAPWRFAAVAAALGDQADFLWVGGGEPQQVDAWIGDAPVRIHEWASPDQFDALMRTADVFLFPTLWEGMALSLIQAQAIGLPAVTSDVVGNRDAVVDNETGFVCRTDEELIEAVRTLISSAELRQRMGARARENAMLHLVDDHIGSDSLKLYGLDIAG